VRRAKSCLIIGAGICGLTAAKLLCEFGMRVSILEKSRGVGGRLATQRTEAGVFDHGAQSLTVRFEIFDSFVTEWHQRGLLSALGQRLRGLPGDPGTHQPHFRGITSMTAVPKFLAAALPHHPSQRAKRAETCAGGWRVTTDQGSIFSGDAFGGMQIEGATLSGFFAARQLLSLSH